MKENQDDSKTIKITTHIPDEPDPIFNAGTMSFIVGTKLFIIRVEGFEHPEEPKACGDTLGFYMSDEDRTDVSLLIPFTEPNQLDQIAAFLMSAANAIRNRPPV